MMTMSNFSNSTLTNETNPTLDSSTSVWARILILTAMIFIDISAFFGNLLVICAFFRTRRLQTVTNYFIASLAFADALVAIFVLPLSIYCYQRDRSWKLGLILCDLWVSSDVLLCTSSILNLTCISVDRYMAITKPLTYTAYRSKFLARVMILLVWIVSAVITCPPIFGWRDRNRRHTVEEKFQCDLNSARGYVVYSALGSFYIPGLVMIFVYIRIFMVVYDRGNLTKKFYRNQTSMTSLKSVLNGSLNQKNELLTKKSRCCFSFRTSKKSTENDLVMNKSIALCSFNQIPAIEQKQNGYLIYRFTNGTKKNKDSTNFSRSTPTESKKIINPMVDEIYQYQRNYLNETVCFECQTFESSLSPLFKCRSRSFEQSNSGKIRDLNSELSHSRQLKAAAAAVAAATTTNSTATIKENLQQENELEQFILPNKEYNHRSYYPSIDENRPEMSQSLTEINLQEQEQQSAKHRSELSQSFPMRLRATTNPSLTSKHFAIFPLRQRTNQPEPTRINRRVKSPRALHTSPSAMLIENFKQQHRIHRNGSLKSIQSSKSLASLCRLKTVNNETTGKFIWKCSICCCWKRSSNFEGKNQVIFFPTPNPSMTNDDEEDEKLSSNETPKVTRTPVHHPSSPGDVHRRERIRFMKEQKTAKILAVVVGGFILLWLPFFTMYVIPKSVYIFPANTVTFITWLGYFNSVINPFIYAYCSKQFRMAFWNITIGICMKKSTTILPSSTKNKQTHQRRLQT